MKCDHEQIQLMLAKGAEVIAEYRAERAEKLKKRHTDEYEAMHSCLFIAQRLRLGDIDEKLIQEIANMFDESHSEFVGVDVYCRFAEKVTLSVVDTISADTYLKQVIAKVRTGSRKSKSQASRISQVDAMRTCLGIQPFPATIH